MHAFWDCLFHKFTLFLKCQQVKSRFCVLFVFTVFLCSLCIVHILRCDNFFQYLVLMHRFNDTYILWGPGSYHLVMVHRRLFNNIRFFILLYNLNFTFFLPVHVLIYIVYLLIFISSSVYLLLLLLNKIFIIIIMILN